MKKFLYQKKRAGRISTSSDKVLEELKSAKFKQVR